jgi:hypothetical protein
MTQAWKALSMPALAAGLCVRALCAADAPQDSEVWRFDRIDSIGGHPTKILGNPLVVDTKIGKAVQFNGVNDGLQLDVHPLAGVETFTLEMIFRPDPGGAPRQRFFHLEEHDSKTGQDTGNGMLFGLRAMDGRWYLDGVDDSSADTKRTIDLPKLQTPGQWYAAALVYDGHQLRSYVNGVLQASRAVRLTPQGPGRTSIGVSTNLKGYFKGAVFMARLTWHAFQPVDFLAVPSFREHTVVSGLDNDYQVVVADLNHDGKPDLIALSTKSSQLMWYENPTWEPHVLATGFNHMINCVAVGADSEGIPEIVLASHFDNLAKNSVGLISVLHHDGDPLRPWKSQEIDRIPSSHRLRLAYLDDSSNPVVIDAALSGANADAPDFKDHTPLVYYRPGIWKRETIQPENFGLVHGLYIDAWDGAGDDEILTAGFEGIHVFKPGTNGQWTRTQVSPGDPAPWPQSGTSDIAVGRLGAERFLAAIEPFHGNQVVIYRQGKGEWQRLVIDSSLSDGHTILTADLEGNGNDVVIAGYRGGAHNLYFYTYDPASGSWLRRTIDAGGMGAAACAIADLNSDGRPDVVCAGFSTGNLKWYENLGR